MRERLLVAILLLFTYTVSAETEMTAVVKSGSLTGIVIDVKTKEPLPYVNVVIRDANNKILTGGITDSDGKFMIKKMRVFAFFKSK